jgi:16S rRNA (cytidine1402-2'-O)-methyltransferase
MLTQTQPTLNPTLYIVATPIGNLEDITLRAIRVLQNVDVIAAEDTRKTLQLLKHLHIPNKPLISYHKFNERGAVNRIFQELRQGRTVAMVTDAGTPSVSDPGFFLVREAIKENIKLVPIPGASALTALVSVSNIPTDKFVFEGFLPQKKGRQTRLQFLKSETRTMIFYESPHRIVRTLADLLATMGDRPCFIGREMTKIHEEFLAGTLSELKHIFDERAKKGKVLGEFVLSVAGLSRHDEAESEEDEPDDDEFLDATPEDVSDGA